MVVPYSALVPVGGHGPLMGFVIGADQEVFDFDISFTIIKQFLYASHDLADTLVALIRRPMGLGDGHLENRDCDGVLGAATDNERIKKWMVVCVWFVVLVFVKRHIQLLRPEVD